MTDSPADPPEHSDASPQLGSPVRDSGASSVSNSLMVPFGDQESSAGSIEKLSTGIPGFDALGFGGLPRGRATLVAGTAGSGKTVFAMQFLAAGIAEGHGGVFVTFEESVADLRRNVRGFGWDIAQWEKDGMFAFVDASPADQPEQVIGAFDLDGLLNRISHAAEKVNAERVSLDSLSGLYGQGFGNGGHLRHELSRLISRLKDRGLTVVLTVERMRERSLNLLDATDEFVSDSLVVLRNTLHRERRRRTVEILKYRGSRHREGESPFTIDPGRGFVSLPLSGLRLTQQSSNERISSGTEELDSMCGGGFFRDSVVLISGPTGTGKTLLSTYFVGRANPGERALYLAYEESREQLFRNAESFGIRLDELEAEGRLKVVCQYPESRDLQGHLLQISDLIDEFKPTRIAMDSLSALERVAAGEHFREFLIGLTSLVKRHEVATLLTSTSRNLVGAKSVSEQHISTLTDSIILLRYVELRGRIRRGLMVLKMRGSAHEDEIRQFTIDGEGVHIHGGFEGVSGIMAGQIRALVTGSGNEAEDGETSLLGGGDG